MLEQSGLFYVPSKDMKKKINDEYAESLKKLKITMDRLKIKKELLKVFPRGPKLKQAYEDYIAGKIDLKGNIINSPKKIIIETTIKEIPEKKKKEDLKKRQRKPVKKY